MIIFYHTNEKVVTVSGATNYKGMRVTEALLLAAREHPLEVVVWCDEKLSKNLNTDVLQSLFHHDRLLFSFNVSGGDYLDPIIGFAEENSPFIPINRTVAYPTWQMSAHVGMVHAAAINAFSPYLKAGDSFDYFLNSFAKRAMRAGLLCYSEPALLRGVIEPGNWKKADTYETFRFVRQHYRMRWTSFLLLDMILFRKEFPIGAYLASLFYGKRKFSETALEKIPIQSKKSIVGSETMDVVIPTIGRREHLYNVLKDLSAQTVLPKKVIIVEQNPISGSVSELDFIQSEIWPFAIDHIFTHRTGACNARNICLSKVESEFVFMADDDIRFGPDILAKAFHYFRATGNEVLQSAGPQAHEEVSIHEIVQHAVFGAGLAFLKSSCLKDVSFHPGFEFGYGEDKDFGMQLRNNGFDILYVPFLSILHLKAPMGGFRFKPELQWSNDKPVPKPSPTVMLYMLRNMTPEQLNGYKVVHFFKNYGRNGNINPLTTYRNFKKRWHRSVFWANQLAKR